MPIKKRSDNMTSSLNKIQRQLANVPSNAHRFFVSVTPKDTGNARSKTTLSGNRIDANYPYAQRLNRGWSKQAPRGMVQPTIRFLRRLIQSIIRK
jgi:hypothetical protein